MRWLLARLIDLASSTKFMDEYEASRLVHTLRPELLITGCSANQAEWALIRACIREGVNAAVMLALRWDET